MISAIMCGGRGSRMSAHAEKPLLKVGGIPMVERVVTALAGSGRFDRIVAAVSLNTPKTKEFLESKGVEIIETAGEGYPQDLSRLLSGLKPEKVMVVPADMPLLDSQAILHMTDIAEKKEPAISIVLEKEFVERIGIIPSLVFGQYCHSGITIFDTAIIATETIQERYVVMNMKEIAFNVNTRKELDLVEKLLVQRA